MAENTKIEWANAQPGLSEKLDQILRLLDRPYVPLDKTLWDSQQCADYFCVSQNHYTQRIAVQPGFPSAIRVPGFRWNAGEIIEWAGRQKAKRKR